MKKLLVFDADGVIFDTVMPKLDNLATAFEAVRQLQALGFPIPEERLWPGVAATHWPGRPLAR